MVSCQLKNALQESETETREETKGNNILSQQEVPGSPGLVPGLLGLVSDSLGLVPGSLGLVPGSLVGT